MLKLFTENAALVATLGTLLTAIVAGVWAVVIFVRQMRDQADTRLFEAKRPFLELQLRKYCEVAEIVGKLAALDIGTPEWDGVVKRFWAMYWSELVIVNDNVVEQRMVELADAVRACEQKDVDGQKRKGLQSAVLGLAIEIRKGITSVWGTHGIIRKPPNWIEPPRRFRS